MAITIKKQPQELTPVYNPMIIALESTNDSEESFQFLADIFVRGDLVTTMKIPVNPEGFGVFDIQRHVENEITFDFDPTNTGFTRAIGSGATYSLSIQEEWRFIFEFIDNTFVTGDFVGFLSEPGADKPLFNVGDEVNIKQNVGATFPEYDGLATITGITQSGTNWVVETNIPRLGSTPENPGEMSLSGFRLTKSPTPPIIISKKDAFNGVLDFYNEILWDDSEYVAGLTESRFLTNVPDVWEVLETDFMWLNVYQRNVAIDKIVFENDAGDTIQISNSFNTPIVDINRFLQIAVGPAQILPQLGTSSFYKFYLEAADGSRITEIKTIKIKKECSKFEKIPLIFLDKLGSFIPYTFTMLNRETKRIERTNYQQSYGRYAPAEQDWTYRSFDRGKKSLDTVVTEQFTINSNWVDNKTSEFLMTLFESPEVYWIRDGVAFAINLTVSTVEKKKTINDGVINYTLTFELSNKNGSQR
jgi:hypothetical protein